VDHVLADRTFQGNLFETSFYNFISDHKSITIRFAINSKLTDEILEKISFESELHLKSKGRDREKSMNNPTKSQLEKSEEYENLLSQKGESNKNQNKSSETGINAVFKRRIKNPDMSTCWLNSCLQLILSGFDHYNLQLTLHSDLGTELLSLKNLHPMQSIDPSTVRNIIVYAEDMRIAMRKSELTSEIDDKHELIRMLENVDRTYLNLSTGQQCVRDFFICLKENMENWLDVYQIFDFNTVNLSICAACGYRSESEQNQIYLELEVPPDESFLSQFVEQTLNEGCMVDYRCEDGCQENFQAEKRTVLKSVRETQFLTILLRRSIISEQF
jgi:hypothetical protein